MRVPCCVVPTDIKHRVVHKSHRRNTGEMVRRTCYVRSNGEMIQSVRLVRYKGFLDCRVPLRGPSILVGANNAGKSTVIHAIRLVAALVPQAQRTKPGIAARTADTTVRGWQITQAALDAASFTSEAVRYEFQDDEARIELEFTNKMRVVVVWPTITDSYGDDPPFYHIIPPEGFRGDARTAARTLIPAIGVVPTLSPLDDREQEISERVLLRNLTSRRTSRSFRNAMWQAFQVDEDWLELREFVLSNTPEIVGMTLVRRVTPEGVELDFFYVEPGSRKEREFVWAGDGLQIWIQILYHVWRNRSCAVIVLDEPDVFLHPDLQRRLARILFALDKQIIMATHSVEVLAETEPGSAVWVDRDRRRGERMKSTGALTAMGRRLGSGLELSLSRALRSRLALFVEGDDLPLLKAIAQQVGAPHVAKADGFSVISLGGFSRNHVAGAFAEVIAALGGDVRVFVALDRDLRCESVVADTERELTMQGATACVWKRREIENYLLDPYALSAITSLDLALAEQILEESIASLSEDTRLMLQTTRLQESRTGGSPTRALSEKTVLELANSEFVSNWASYEGRVSTVDAKAVISNMNTALRARRLRTISSLKLAKAMPHDGVGADLRQFILDLEVHLTTR